MSDKKKGCGCMGLLGFIALIGGLYADVFTPVRHSVKNWWNPPLVWECSQDDNVRGKFFVNLPKYSSGEMTLNYGEKRDLINFNHPLKKNESISSCQGDKHGDDIDCLLGVKVDIKRNISINAKIYNEFGEIVSKIEDNKFLLNRDCILTYNLDENGFEVIDDNYHVIFNLDYNDNEIRFNGILFGRNTVRVYLADKKESIKYTLDNPIKKELIAMCLSKRKEIKKLFCYTGEDWFMKRLPCE